MSSCLSQLHMHSCWSNWGSWMKADTKIPSLEVTLNCTLLFLLTNMTVINIYEVVLLVRNVMAHVQKPEFVFPRNGRVHSNRCGRQFSRLLAAEVWGINFSNAGYTAFGGGVRVLATHSIRQFPLHFPSRSSPCATRFRTSSSNTSVTMRGPAIFLPTHVLKSEVFLNKLFCNPQKTWRPI